MESEHLPNWAEDIYTDPIINLPFADEIVIDDLSKENDGYENNQCIISAIVADYLGLTT